MATRPLHIGALALGDLPRIAVPLLDDDPRGDVAAIRGLADLVELRIDGFGDPSPDHAREVINAVRHAESRLPIIATVRSGDEGAFVALSDQVRAALYDTVIPLTDAVDIELRSPLRDRVITETHRHGRIAIASYHDFSVTPSTAGLDEIVARGRAAGADIVKIAAAVADLGDIRRLLDLTLRHRDVDMVTIALGAAGAISRIVFPLAGSRFTFAFHRTPSGPGQLPLRELHAELCRYYPAFAAQAAQRHPIL